MRPRIKDVAARAEVSTATVSVVLNDVEGSRVAAATRDRIKAAARELGYTPNSLARGLRTRRTHTIGMLSDRIATTPYASRMILGAQRAAWEAGYLLLLISVDEEPDVESEAIRALAERQVDGILYATMYHRIVSLPSGLGGVPTVVLDAEVADRSVSTVVPDEESGGYDATSFLTSQGHRRIAYLANSEHEPATGLRQAGYVRALAAAGIPFDESLVASAAPSSAGGRQAASSLLERPDPPTAIFAFNDPMAVGVYQTARRLRLNIPGDLSIVGFDDHELIAAEMDPGLTTMALPHEAMGAWAAKRLIAMIEGTTPQGEEANPESKLEPCPIVIRGSVGAPRAEGL